MHRGHASVPTDRQEDVWTSSTKVTVRLKDSRTLLWTYASLLTGEPRDVFPIPTALVRAHLVRQLADSHGSTTFWSVVFFRAASFSRAGWTHRPICLHQQRKLTEAHARDIDGVLAVCVWWGT